MIPETSRQQKENVNTTFEKKPLSFVRAKSAVPAEMNMSSRPPKDMYIFNIACDNARHPSFQIGT